MKHEVLGSCPLCSNDLKVTELNCKKCGITIKGEFNLCKFCRLDKEQKNFIEVFIKNRGNIKDIEKELGVSYPTVRRLLDNAIEALGHKSEKAETSVDKMEILDRLSKGDITSEEALKLLK